MPPIMGDPHASLHSEGHCPKCRQPLGIGGTCHACLISELQKHPGPLVLPSFNSESWPTRDAIMRLLSFAEERLDYGDDPHGHEEVRIAANVVRRAFDMEPWRQGR